MPTPTLQDIFATVRDPMEVQAQLLQQQQQVFAQLQNPTQQFGAALANIGMNLARRWRTGDDGQGVLHRMRSGDPAAPEVARAEHTQEAIDRAISSVGAKREDETDQDFEFRMLDAMRRETDGEQYNPETRQAIASRYSTLATEKYERSRLMESDEIARAEAQRRARAAEIDVQLGELRITQMQRAGSTGEGAFGVFELGDGSQLDRRVDSTEADAIVAAGGKFLGTREQLRQAQLERERLAVTGQVKPARLTVGQIDSFVAIQSAVKSADRALALLNKGTFSTGLLSTVGGLREWGTRTGVLDFVGLGNEDFTAFLQESDRMRLTFQELAKGNPSNMENELFIRANFDATKSVGYNIGIAELVHEQMADRIRLEISAAIQNNQAVPTEALNVAKSLGIDPASIDASFGMDDLDRRAAARVERLEQLNQSTSRSDEEEDVGEDVDSFLQRLSNP